MSIGFIFRMQEKAESLIHRSLAAYRQNKKREFFSCDIDMAIDAFMSINMPYSNIFTGKFLQSEINKIKILDETDHNQEEKNNKDTTPKKLRNNLVTDQNSVGNFAKIPLQPSKINEDFSQNVFLPPKDKQLHDFNAEETLYKFEDKFRATSYIVMALVGCSLYLLLSSKTSISDDDAKGIAFIFSYLPISYIRCFIQIRSIYSLFRKRVITFTRMLKTEPCVFSLCYSPFITIALYHLAKAI